MTYKPLRLKGEDVEDLEILSALLQDAVVFMGETAYVKSQLRFGLMLARFVWEDAEEKRGARRRRQRIAEGGDYLRVRGALHFDFVREVKSRGLSQQDKTAVLELLAISAEKQEDGQDRIVLSFAGGGEIALMTDCIEAAYQDRSEPWATPAKPAHEAD
ncbi:MAG: DUF2948 family protein [Alphaproteobacteria bacterium]